MLPRPAFLLEPCQHTPKTFEYDQIKTIGSKDVATKPVKRERQNHKLPLSRHFLKPKMSFLVKLSHKIFPLFNRFSTFVKNVNLSKANPEAKFFFLPSPR